MNTDRDDCAELKHENTTLRLALQIKALELDSLLTALGVQDTTEALEKIQRLVLAWLRQN